MTTTQKPIRQHGSTVIEFGLVGLVFFLVMLGFFEFCRAFYVINSMQHLTRCIARAAVVVKPSLHDEAKQLRSSDGQQCLMSGGHWPFFTLNPTDLRSAFRLEYTMKTVGEAGNVTITTVSDDDSGVDAGSYDNQAAACIAQTNCITEVTAYYDADNINNYVETLGLLAAWIAPDSIGPDSSYKSFKARTTMPAESMGGQAP